jgi:hypothetical protein
MIEKTQIKTNYQQQFILPSISTRGSNMQKTLASGCGQVWRPMVKLALSSQSAG